MKPVIRYLIVCIVMAIFVGIVVYFLIYQNPPKKVSGPCGSGKCNDEIKEPVTAETASTFKIANILNEHSISTHPVKESVEGDADESDDEDIPDLVEAFVPPIEAIAGLSQFMQSMNMEQPVNNNQTVIEEISDSSSGEEENEIVSCGKIHELANEIVKQVDKDETVDKLSTAEEVEPISEATPAPPPTPKRRGRPKSTSKKEKEIYQILSTPDKALNSIEE